ncbi:hypothetical protein CR513_09545, partial [Mucuna pruriens]
MCPTLQEEESKKYIMHWSTRRRIPIWKAVVFEPATILAEFESREAYSTEVWTSQGHAWSESSKLSTVGSEILGTNVLPTPTTTNATTRKSFHNGRFD